MNQSKHPSIKAASTEVGRRDVPPVPTEWNPFIVEPAKRRAQVREASRVLVDKPELYHESADSSVRVYLGDALRLLKACRDEFFDMVFADPPYFLSNGGITCQAGRMVSVDKGEWDKAKSFEAAHEFNVEWLRECKRVLKPNGTIWVSGTRHNIYSIGFAMQSLGYKILNDIAWYKINPPPNLSCRYFVHATETVLWAARDAKTRHYFDYEQMKRIGDPRPGKQMHSLWRIRPPTPWEKRYSKHPTQKPEALLDRIVLASTKEGDVVLDPFLGSGTTAVACTRRGRRCVGFDVDLGYLGIAVRRICDELMQSELDFGSSKGHGGNGTRRSREKAE